MHMTELWLANGFEIHCVSQEHGTIFLLLSPPHHCCPGSSHSHPQMPAFQHAKVSQHRVWASWFEWKQSQHKQKLNPKQTHSPIVHQHVQKDVPCHALGPYSFLQLWSSSCTYCTVPIIQQVKKTHKESIQVSDHFCEGLRFAYWNFAKPIPSYTLSQP